MAVPESRPAQPPGALRARLRSALATALRERDRTAVGAVRTALAALDNAEAVPVPAPAASLPAVPGVGGTDVPRRTLTEGRERELVGREVSERVEAAAQYAAAGQHRAADRLRAEAAVLAAVLEQSAQQPATGEVGTS